MKTRKPTTRKSDRVLIPILIFLVMLITLAYEGIIPATTALLIAIGVLLIVVALLLALVVILRRAFYDHDPEEPV